MAPLVVCGGQRASLADGHLDKELPPHSVYMERCWGSHGNPGGWGNPSKAELGPSRAAQLWYKGTGITLEALQEGGCGTDCTNYLSRSAFVLVHWTKCVMSTKFSR